MKAVIEILKSIVRDADFSSSTNFIDDELLDSFDLIELIAAIEGEYDIEIEGDDIIPDNFESVDKIEALIEKYKR